MKKKDIKIGIIISSILLVLLLSGIGYLYWQEMQYQKVYKSLTETVLQQVKKDTPNVAYLDKRQDTSNVIGYFPIDEHGAGIEVLTATMKSYLVPLNNQGDYLFTAFYYKQLANILPETTVYQLYKDVYSFNQTAFQLKSSTISATNYYHKTIGWLTIDKLLVSPLTDKEKIVALFKECVKNSVTSSDQAACLSAIDKGIDTLHFVYTDRQFALSFGTVKETLLVDIPLDKIVPYFKSFIIFDAQKSMYNEQQDILKKQRESEVSSKLDSIVNDIKEIKPTKRVALTFDDGPNLATTPKALDILKKHDAKATFYILGERIAGAEHLLKQQVEQGHELGNHSWSHASLIELTDENIHEEFYKTEQAIKDATGVIQATLRPPYGAYNLSVTNITNVPIILWSVDSKDWIFRNSETTKANILANVHDGAIILMHDIHEETVNMLDSLIVELKERGYEFVTVSDLYDKDTLVPGITYFNENDALKIVE